MEIATEPLSEDALLLRFGDRIDPDLNARVHAAARALREAKLPGLVDIAPAYASLLLRFETGSETGSGSLSLAASLRNIIEAESEPDPVSPDPVSPEPHPVSESDPAPVSEIPVCYGGAFGPDLEAAAAHAGLAPDAFVARHTAGDYTVAMLGFAPGFPYLLGLAAALHMPRRATPRTRVPAGSVAIGGAQTGIYPSDLPGGWQLIGRTPLTLFDPRRESPCLLAPGDRVRFRAVDADEFARLAAAAS